MKESLSLAPSLPEDSMMTLRQLAGEALPDDQIDAALQVELGDEVHYLDTTDLYGLMPNWPALRMREFGGSVLVRYAGMVSELSITDERRRHLASLKTLVGAVACFDVVQASEVIEEDTSRYPEGISSTLMTRQIGVSIDQVLQLRSLEDGLREMELQATISHQPALTVVR